mgnify:CR=1 FL=1|jgi:ABC-type sugar transport system, periplasmic component
MKKQFKLFSIVLAIALILTACGGGGSSSNGGGSSDGSQSGGGGESGKKIKVGIVYTTLTNEFAVKIQAAVREKAQELGIELLEADGQGKPENQIAQVENFITQKVDAIILQPYDRNGTAPAVDKAVNANIPIVVVNAQTSNVEKALAYVGSDDVYAGELEMQYIADQLGGKGNIVIIRGPYGNSAEVDRTEGNRNVLAKYPDINVLADQTANWDRAEAMVLMENWLQTYPDIDAVVAQNDEMALGAYQAIKAAKKENEILVIGIDAIEDALKSVANGEMVATVFQDAVGQGHTAVELAVKAAKGEAVEFENWIPFILVTQENINDFLKQ